MNASRRITLNGIFNDGNSMQMDGPLSNPNDVVTKVVNYWTERGI